MKTSTIENITGLIVLAIYLVMVFFVVAITYPSQSVDDFEQIIQETAMVSPIPKHIRLANPIFLNKVAVSNDDPIIEPLPEPTDKPVLVAEPLYGKELYIFYIAQIVEQYYPDVDPYIALSVLEVESDYNPKTYSSAGAVGLMQVIPKYHAWRVEKYGLNDLWDPYTNIICGMDFLNESYLKYGDWSKALIRYNNSETYVKYVLYKADILREDGYFG